jgi:hypothetical protein
MVSLSLCALLRRVKKQSHPARRAEFDVSARARSQHVHDIEFRKPLKRIRAFE